MSKIRKFINGTLSELNSSSVVLGAGATFTGQGEDVTEFVEVRVAVFSDVGSAVDGLTIEYSTDNVNWDHDDAYTVPANTGKNYGVQRVAKYYRVVYVNGGAGQASFRLSTILNSVAGMPSSHRIQDSISSDDDAVLVKSVLTGIDENGVFQNARFDSGGYIIPADFMLEVARGHIPGHSIYRKFGKVDNIQATTPADCWEFGGVEITAAEYTWSTTAAIDSISSDDAADTETVDIVMLDINHVEFTQTATLNGQTRVALTPGYRLNRAFNSNGVATLGNVYIYEDTPIVGGVPTLKTKVRGYFSIIGQQTLQAIYTVPAGKTAYLYELKTSMGGRKTGFATYEAFLRVVGSIFLIKDNHDLAATGSSYANDVFSMPRAFPEKTDFKPKITVDTNGIGFTVAFVVLLIDN